MFTGLINAFRYGSNYSQPQNQMVPYTPKETDYTPVMIGAGLLVAFLTIEYIFKKK